MLLVVLVPHVANFDLVSPFTKPESIQGRVFWDNLLNYDPYMTELQDKLRLRQAAAATNATELADLPRVQWIASSPSEIPKTQAEDAIVKPNNACGRIQRIPKHGSARGLVDWWFWAPHMPLWERAYQEISPRVFAESIVCDACPELQVFVIDSRARFAQLRTFDEGVESRSMYEIPGWRFMGPSARFSSKTTAGHPDGLPRPSQLDSCLEAAERLSNKRLGLLRVDFFLPSSDSRPILGEVAVYPGGGLIGTNHDES